jgi:hypothetical protein
VWGRSGGGTMNAECRISGFGKGPPDIAQGDDIR